MTRILLVSDLHYPSDRGLAWVLTEVLRRINVDALVLGGDFVDHGNENDVDRLLALIRRTHKGPILAVWGNHEHYLSRSKVRDGWTSLDQLERLRQVMVRHGTLILDVNGPVRIGDISLVGVVGWYDYSYGPPQFTEEDYGRCNPFGYSLEELQHCSKNPYHPWCPPWWRNDCLYVRLPMHHRDYAKLNAEKLESQLRAAEPPVMVVLHHVPRRDLIRYTGNPQEDFDYAYAGSPVLGEVINSYAEKIAVIAYGHLHDGSAARLMTINGIQHVNTYPNYSKDPGFVLVTVEGGRASITMIRYGRHAV